jgi:hypothetical protein
MKNDGLDAARGIKNGVLISIVIWCIIIGLTILMCSCKKIEYDNTSISSLANATCKEVLVAQEKCEGNGGTTTMNACSDKYRGLVMAKCGKDTKE